MHKKRAFDDVGNALEITDHVIIPKTQNSKLLILQMPIALPVLALRFRQIVLTPIEFDDESCRVAGEVYNELVDRNLPSEVKTFCFECTEKLPELTLGKRRTGA